MSPRLDLGPKPRLGYTASLVERAAERRMDAATLAALENDGRARAYVIGGELVVLKKAAELNEQGVKTPRTAREKKPFTVPAELKGALKKNKKAAAAFEKFPPSHKREYAEWISEAKGADTRQRRVETAVEWIAEGKGRNWKYQR